MSEQEAARPVRASAEQVMHLLRQPALLPAWNPAFISLTADGPVTPGVQFPLRVRPGLAGSFEYVTLDPLMVGMRWSVAGLVEDSRWRVEPQTPGWSIVTHWLRRRGPLASVLARADRGIAGLRLARLDEFLAGTPATP
jgi:hypothetical protein